MERIEAKGSRTSISKAHVSCVADCPFIKNMIVLETLTILKQNHFYVLDDHLNSAGHEVMADAIVKAIGNAERREKKLDNIHI